MAPHPRRNFRVLSLDFYSLRFSFIGLPTFMLLRAVLSSSETQQAAIDLVETLSEKLDIIGNVGPQDSPEVRRAYEEASLDIGDRAVLRRALARTDLTPSQLN
jgi:hypothetical protein